MQGSNPQQPIIPIAPSQKIGLSLAKKGLSSKQVINYKHKEESNSLVDDLVKALLTLTLD